MMRQTPAPLPQAPLDDAQRLACLRLARSDNVGPVTFRELINHFGGAAQALEALPELAHRGGGRRPIRICSQDAAERELATARRCGAAPVFTIEPGYPPLLARIEVPPPLLYVKGLTELLRVPGIAIVGSRNASGVGLKLTRTMVRDLGAAGYVIVSGLARGIDAAAHHAALDTGTTAALAGGIDIVYPPEHADLQARLAEEGCLVSEMPPGFQPRAQDFPRRNRIVSGMAYGVVVMEAARRSGSLITARMAGEQGREVFAVPGHPLDPRAEGVNQLLRSGATLVTNADDVIMALRPIVDVEADRPQEGRLQEAERGPGSRVPAGPEASKRSGVTTTSQRSPTVGPAERHLVLSALGAAPVSVDDIARACAVAVHVVQAVVLELAIAGRIERHGSQLVSLRPNDV